MEPWSPRLSRCQRIEADAQGIILAAPIPRHSTHGWHTKSLMEGSRITGERCGCPERRPIHGRGTTTRRRRRRSRRVSTRGPGECRPHRSPRRLEPYLGRRPPDGTSTASGASARGQAPLSHPLSEGRGFVNSRPMATQPVPAGEAGAAAIIMSKIIDRADLLPRHPSGTRRGPGRGHAPCPLLRRLGGRSMPEQVSRRLRSCLNYP